jgi:hypothetical protein
MESLMQKISALLGILLSAALGHAQEAVDFDRSIAPLLVDRCLDCHSGTRPKGKLDLSRKASAFQGGRSGNGIVPRNLAKSEVWRRVGADEMPPKKPLPEKEKAILKAWIAAGAGWGSDPIDPYRFTTSRRAGYDWWSLQPVKRPALPVVKQKEWPRNAIDHFILAKLEAEGLTPSPEADRRTLIRRLCFDLTGLPPTPAEVSSFVLSPDAAESDAPLVDRLLASPNYGERWARHWLDIVRFGESNGFEYDELRKNAWPYRDWVIQAFNQDLPFNEFARQQIAGDVLQPSTGGVATGFLVAGSFDSVGQIQQSAAMKAVVRQDELEDIVSTIGQTFLGLTVQCARCHDHKFDPIRIDEYYRLTAAVAGVRHGERDMKAPPFAPPLNRAALEAKLADAQKRLAAQDAPLRREILDERRKKGVVVPIVPPKGLARWDFTRSLKDEIGGVEATLHSDATLTAGGLQLGGSGYARTPPLSRAMRAKTLTATVRLRDLEQRGGAAISLQSPDGARFDAIVFGEREPGRWLAGSDGFGRTQDLDAPAEKEAATKPVHIAIAYHVDGTIAAYRNGIPYGKPYKANSVLSLEPNEAVLLFGLRHSPPGENKHLSGSLLRAELYDRALTPDEVAASAGVATDYVSEEEIVARLGKSARDTRNEIKRSIAEAERGLAALLAMNRVYAVVPRPPEATHLLIRGNPAQPGPVLAPGAVASLGLPADFGLAADAPDGERRVKLAEWITSDTNPLFARVLVNRLWHYHFGVGLVETPSDFGFNGGRPSHPELLDWLADEFINSGYSVKHVHRLIVQSATYRQSSRFRADAGKRDANNRWLWRKSPMRLEAEAVRDSILRVADQLNLAHGGPGYQDFKLTIRGATYYYTPIDEADAAHNRRSVYRTWARSGRSGLLDVLDCPDPSTVSPRRAVTTTPLQALSLLNNGFMLRMADRFAERVQRDAGDDAIAQIRRAYELAYARPPDDDEVRRVRPIVERHGLAVFCRALFNSSEFVYVD